MLETVVNQSVPLPVNSKMLVLGGGFSGQHIASVTKALGGNVLCSRRDSKSVGADFSFNSKSDQIPSINILEGVTHLISCIPPNQDGKDPVIEKLKKEIKNMPISWIGYLSTTGVYGDSKGEWVNEQTIPKPKQLRSKNRLACEQEWLELGLPVQILRLPGIYGPGRSALESIVKGKYKLVDKPGQVFSRIHIDDIAGAIMHLIDLASKGKMPKIINIADNLPTNNIEVLEHAASLINYKLPAIESYKIASQKMSPMALSFWQENRRISNQLLCKSLNYSLIHNDYKLGLKDCLSQLNEN